jgi:phosphatidylglycerol---prolipoprotein diacylglyceryl transferase
MITISIDPVIFHIGHFAIRWYGLIVMTAISVGVWLSVREAKRKGFNEEDLSNVAVWVVVGGFLGARLFHVIDHWPHKFFANPISALYLWEGGLAIWGGVIGGFMALALLARRNNWNLPLLLDAVAPGLVLAQAIGRFACIITGDAMGKPTSGPFGFAYANPAAMVPELGVYYAPMPVYEIMANLMIFWVVWQLRKRDWPAGLLFLVYISLYSLERFFLAFTSSYQIIAFDLTQSQIIALTLLKLSLPMMLVFVRKKNYKIAI